MALKKRFLMVNDEMVCLVAKSNIIYNEMSFFESLQTSCCLPHALICLCRTTQYHCTFRFLNVECKMTKMKSLVLFIVLLASAVVCVMSLPSSFKVGLIKGTRTTPQIRDAICLRRNIRKLQYRTLQSCIVRQ